MRKAEFLFHYIERQKNPQHRATGKHELPFNHKASLQLLQHTNNRLNNLVKPSIEQLIIRRVIDEADFQ